MIFRPPFLLAPKVILFRKEKKKTRGATHLITHAYITINILSTTIFYPSQQTHTNYYYYFLDGFGKGA